MKKLLALLLAAMMLLSTMASCGKKDEPSSPSSDPVSESTPESAPESTPEPPAPSGDFVSEELGIRFHIPEDWDVQDLTGLSSAQITDGMEYLPEFLAESDNAGIMILSVAVPEEVLKPIQLVGPGALLTAFTTQISGSEAAANLSVEEVAMSGRTFSCYRLSLTEEDGSVTETLLGIDISSSPVPVVVLSAKDAVDMESIIAMFDAV